MLRCNLSTTISDDNRRLRSSALSIEPMATRTWPVTRDIRIGGSHHLVLQRVGDRLYQWGDLPKLRLEIVFLGSRAGNFARSSPL